MRKYLFPFFLSAIVTINVYAIPAKPVLLTKTLSDGSTLSAYLHGDEDFHYYTTADDYLLLPDEKGCFYYAMEKEGRLVASPFRAKDRLQRTDDERQFLKSVDKTKLLSAFEQQKSGSVMRRIRPNRALQKTSYPTKGLQKAIVILVEYADRKFTVDEPAKSFWNLLNEEGYNKNNATGSARDYFMASSSGQFIPEFDIYGPVTLAHDMGYYGGPGKAGSDDVPEEMVIEACRLLDPEIDFTDYDRDGDGIIDNVYIFYAGYGEASSGIENTVWPHSWDISEATKEEVYLDGVRLDHYACSNELIYPGSEIVGIGTFCHEFSHVLGLPDLYATTYSRAFTPGSWSLMDHGSYNNDEKTPPYLSAYERYALGWISPIEIGEAAELTLDTISTNAAYIIKTGKETEYFLLENRQQASWDRYIPGHGMLIWHIDYVDDVWGNNVVNNTPAHQYVDIEEADGMASVATRDGDAFPGVAHVTAFTDETTPNMQMWGGANVNKPITDIEEEDGIIRFKVSGGESVVYDVCALPATNIAETSFVANWEPNDVAISYVIDVYKKEYGDPDSVNVDFARGATRLPAGWQTSTKLAYAAEGYFGKSKPALLFFADGEYLESPFMNADIRGLSFWYRALDVEEGNSLLLEGYVNKEWVLLDSITSILDIDGGTVAEWKENTDNVLIKGIKAIRITNKCPQNGRAVIDDVVLAYGGKVSLSYLDGYERKNVGNMLSCVVEGLEEGIDYYYVVRAFDGEDYSNASNEIYVSFSGNTDMDVSQIEYDYSVYTRDRNIIIYSTVDNTAVTVVNAQGIVLLQSEVMSGENSYAFPDKGIYIVRIGEKIYKVII